jgi:hypothetical protein
LFFSKPSIEIHYAKEILDLILTGTVGAELRLWAPLAERFFFISNGGLDFEMFDESSRMNIPGTGADGVRKVFGVMKYYNIPA